MPSDDSQLDALEHSVDVAAVQNSLAHMSMPHAPSKTSRRPQANSPGKCSIQAHWHSALLVCAWLQRLSIPQLRNAGMAKLGGQSYAASLVQS